MHASGLFAADDVLVIKGTANGLDRTRLGLAVSRRVGNAVMRNRWKRLIREAFRRIRDKIPVGMDLVARPRKGARADLRQVQLSLVNLGQRLNRKIQQQQ